MKRAILPFKRFYVKVTVVLICSMLIVLLMSNLLIYRASLRSQFEGLRTRLTIIAQTAALSVDPQVLLSVPLTHIDGVRSPEYKSIFDQLRKIKGVSSQIKYIYTMRKTVREGIWQFVVDADIIEGDMKLEDLTKEIIKEEELDSLPGDTYLAGRFPEMMKAFDGPSADTQLEVDQWGATLSGYAPIRDEVGRAVAMLGVDIAADDVYAMQQEVKHRTILVLFLGLILSLILGAIISKSITIPIERLARGVQRVGKGDLLYRVEVKGDDEISQLGKDFNQMSRDLFKARRRLIEYFFNVVRTLVNVLEARDEYTKGHSEEVADLAGKVAKHMGYPREDIKIFKKLTILHDIGKVGVEDSILRKPGKLTEEEWEKIKKHPEIGEKILKPVLDDEDLLGVVRGHHERYDGKGYPDQRKGEELNILAAIVTVVDAYHAMTSDRSYRKAMTQEDAIAELKKHRGTQFHPKVVDTFLKVLEEEG